MKINEEHSTLKKVLNELLTEKSSIKNRKERTTTKSQSFQKALIVK